LDGEVAWRELLDRRLQSGPVDEDLAGEGRATDGPRDVAPRGRAIFGLRRQELEDDGLELVRDVAHVRAGRLDGARAHDVEERLAAEPAVQRPAREALPEDDAERVEVAAPVDSLAAGLLGRHVPELPLQDALLLDHEARAR